MVKLVKYQRKMAEGLDVVLEGRDIGTVVFPKADFKFFLVADIHERAKRRLKEMETICEDISIEELTVILNDRDMKDLTREHSPLEKADDAIEIDTSGYLFTRSITGIPGCFVRPGGQLVIQVTYGEDRYVVIDRSLQFSGRAQLGHT